MHQNSEPPNLCNGPTPNEFRMGSRRAIRRGRVPDLGRAAEAVVLDEEPLTVRERYWARAPRSMSDGGGRGGAGLV